MRRAFIGCVLSCLAAASALGQKSSPVVEARMVLATDAVHPNSHVKAAVVAQIAPGFHVNDHHPSQDYLIPTELKLEGTEQVGVEKITYPKGELQKFAFSDSALSVYQGALVVGTVLKIAPTARRGAYEIRGKLAYQACNDHACFPPASVLLALNVKVVGRGVHLKRQNADVFDKIKLE